MSQGIESELLRTDQGWGLRLPAREAPRARDILIQYERENRHWYRYFQSSPEGPGFHTGVFLWALLLLGVHLAVSLASPDLRSAGLTDTTHLLDGQVWRLWTSVSMHANVHHLIGNLTFGTLLLGFAMGRFGGGWAQLAALLCGVAANLVSALLHGYDHRSLGASGMVMAGLGMLATSSFQPGHTGVPLRIWLLRSVLAAALLFVLIGLDPASDVVAHLVGFLAGGIAGMLLNAMPAGLRHGVRANHLTAILALTMLIAAWSAAIAAVR